MPVRAEARTLKLPVITMFKPSHDIDKEIIETANLGNFDLMIVGIGQSVFEGTLLGKVLGFTTKIINPERLLETITGKERFFDNSGFDERTRRIVRAAKVPVGVFIDKGLENLDQVFIPLASISDSFLLVYAQKLIHNTEARVVIVDDRGITRKNPELKETIRLIEQTAPNHIALQYDQPLDKEFLGQQNLMIISLDSWTVAVESRALWLSANAVCTNCETLTSVLREPGKNILAAHENRTHRPLDQRPGKTEKILYSVFPGYGRQPLS